MQMSASMVAPAGKILASTNILVSLMRWWSLAANNPWAWGFHRRVI